MSIINSVEECFDKTDITDNYPSFKVNSGLRVYEFECKICGWKYNPIAIEAVYLGSQSLGEYLFQHILLTHVHKVDIPDEKKQYECQNCKKFFLIKYNPELVCPFCKSWNIREINKG